MRASSGYLTARLTVERRPQRQWGCNFDEIQTVQDAYKLDPFRWRVDLHVLQWNTRLAAAWASSKENEGLWQSEIAVLAASERKPSPIFVKETHLPHLQFRARCMCVQDAYKLESGRVCDTVDRLEERTAPESTVP